ncbi:enoyl-CoA hydratase [Loktanella sp. TSTF-M6]|uniref:Enoyl-CoA hydratase domain-containing protein 3, mitochondrial n=1 Tax=Loktanella gaetbuli TaxID=2881335 RepID=A0ABS8BQF1_9RHOB|nr:enoyl-CoA hydratase [Loktanella gaetbuli]MCB5197960.1 enoyl-CoA hydratase [Loktanella gaetbuli]
MTILLRTDQDQIATLTLNDPDKLNALSVAMLTALHAELDRIAADDAIRVVIIQGAGRAFCAGHDLSEMQAMRASAVGPAQLRALFDRCTAMMTRIQSLPQPVIAQVHGLAAAAGCQLVATCDLATASVDARFGVNGVNIGLFCSTPMVALTRNIAAKPAFEMLTTGRFLSADEAQHLGLINRTAKLDNLTRDTRSLAGGIAKKLSTAVRIGKQAFYAQAQMPTAQAYAYTGDVMVQNMADDDTAEGIAAFLEKRDPDWS